MFPGSIEVKEVPFAMGALGWKPDPEKVKEVLTTIKQKEGQVTYDTFVKQMTPILKSQTDLDRLRVAFDLMDSDKHGYLTFKDLLKAAQEVGEEELDERDFEEMIKIADSAGKGMVSFDDFVAIMNYKPVKK